MASDAVMVIAVASFFMGGSWVGDWRNGGVVAIRLGRNMPRSHLRRHRDLFVQRNFYEFAPPPTPLID